MKQKIAIKAQKFFTQISINTIGRSIPFAIYEKKIPQTLLDEVDKMREDLAKKTF